MQPENIMLMHGTLMPPPLSAAGPFEWDAATHLTLIDLGSAVSDYFPRLLSMCAHLCSTDLASQADGMLVMYESFDQVSGDVCSVWSCLA